MWKVLHFALKKWEFLELGIGLLLQWPKLYYRRIIRLRRIIRTSVQLYSVLRQIVEQNSSEADSSVSTSSRRANRRKFVLDGWSVAKFISRRNEDGFLTKGLHERDWFLYFGNVPSFRRVTRVKYLDKLFARFVFVFILRRINRLTDNPSRGIVCLKYKFGQRYGLRPSRPLFR